GRADYTGSGRSRSARPTGPRGSPQSTRSIIRCGRSSPPAAYRPEPRPDLRALPVGLCGGVAEAQYAQAGVDGDSSPPPGASTPVVQADAMHQARSEP